MNTLSEVLLIKNLNKMKQEIIGIDGNLNRKYITVGIRYCIDVEKEELIEVLFVK